MNTDAKNNGGTGCARQLTAQKLSAAAVQSDLLPPVHGVAVAATGVYLSKTSSALASTARRHSAVACDVRTTLSTLTQRRATFLLELNA